MNLTTWLQILGWIVSVATSVIALLKANTAVVKVQTVEPVVHAIISSAVVSGAAVAPLAAK